jgi:hypothetical protein
LAPSLDIKSDLANDYVARRSDADFFERNGNALCRLLCDRALSDRGRVHLEGRGLFRRSERLKQAKGYVAMDRILARAERDRLAEEREIQGPVDEQQYGPRLTEASEMVEQEPGRKPKAREQLDPLDANNGPLQR